MQQLQKYKKTELGEIPAEWTIDKLEEIGDLAAGGTPSRFVSEYWMGGTIPWLSSGEIRNNIIVDSNEKITQKGLSKSAARLFPKGTILIAITGQGLTRGRTALLNIDSTTNQSVIGIICKPKIINNIFLWYFLQNQYWNLRSISQGSNQAGLNLTLLKSYRILLPPVEEQQKIASILSNVDELIQKTDQIIEQTQRLKKGLMRRLLTKGIENRKFKKVLWFSGKYVEIPESWEFVKIQNVLSKIKRGPSLSTNTVGDGVIYLTSDYITEDGILQYGNLKFLSVRLLDDVKKYVIDEGNVILNCVNSLDQIGKASVFVGYPETVIVGFNNFALELKSNINSFYLKYLFLDPVTQYFFKSLAKPAVHQVSFSSKDLLKMNIPLPPIKEQEKIAEILSNLDELIEAKKLENIKSKQFKKGLMQKLLTGKIRAKV